MVTQSLTDAKIEAGKKITLDDIKTDLNNGLWDALYYATEEQISTLIGRGDIDEDFFSRHQNYQEEMRVMMAEI